jgi:hypothetical protein
MEATSGCRGVKLINPPWTTTVKITQNCQKQSFQGSGNWPKINNKLRIVYL